MLRSVLGVMCSQLAAARLKFEPNLSQIAASSGGQPAEGLACAMADHLRGSGLHATLLESQGRATPLE